MNVEHDVVFIGGGPAASLCAALILRSDPTRRVLILEGARFPRPHVGEAVLPSWRAILERAGVLDLVDAATSIKKLGIRFAWGPPTSGEVWTADFREENGRAPAAAWHVQRDVFDSLLLDHAAQLGARVRQGATVSAVRTMGPANTPPIDDSDVDGYEVTWREDGTERKTSADYLVDASGQQRLLARAWDIPLHRKPDMNNYAVHGYWTGSQIEDDANWPMAPDERWAVVASCEVGWIWHIPIARDLVSVGLVTHRDTLRAHGAAELDTLYREGIASSRVAGLLGQARCIGGTPTGDMPSRLSVVSDWAYQSDRVCGPRWFMAGDAAMFVDPILSSGLVLASQAALMVANALRTLWTDPDVDRPRLRASFTRRYESLGGTYHRMARAWYRRNARAASWHWQAHQERLRAGGEALYERDADALTAISMGTVVDPVESVARRQEPALVSWFGWATAERLFHDDLATKSDGWGRVSDTRGARSLARTLLRARWQRLARSKLTLRASSPRTVDAYHTHDQLDHWEPITYVALQVSVHAPEAATTHPSDGALELAFPALGGRTLRVLAALDGHQRGDAIVRDALQGLQLGTDEREIAATTLLELLLQLDMLGRLEAGDPMSPVALSGHPFGAVLLDALLRAAEAPAEVAIELDLVGATCRASVAFGGGTMVIGLADIRECRRDRFSHFSRTTAASIISSSAGPRASAILAAMMQKLDAHPSPRAASLWDECAAIPALSLLARYDVDRSVTISREEASDDRPSPSIAR